MSFNLQNYHPGLRNNVLKSRTWATTGNTDVVADANVASNTLVDIMQTSAYVGPWYVTINPGVGFTVTSSNSETAGLTYSYLLL